ncbi:MAG: VCBS repeat-containing protein, partial [Acidobacteriota bacterium]
MTKISAVLLAACLFAAAPAGATTFRNGATTAAIIAAVRGTSIAYDSVNRVYLVVSSYGLVQGRFVSATGTPLGSQFQIQASGVYSHFPRATFSPDADGGKGGFLVTWSESDLDKNYTSVHGRIVSYASGGTIGPDNRLGYFTDWKTGCPVAYSTKSKVFLVAWHVYPTGNDIAAVRVDNAANVLGAVDIPSSPDGERDPSVAYNPVTDQFLIVYSGYNNSYAFVGSRRVQAGTGALLDVNRTDLYRARGTFITDVTYNSARNEFLAVWWSSGATLGVRVDAGGSPTGDVITMSTRWQSYDAVSAAYNPRSDSYFMVTHSNTAEDGGVEIYSNGLPIDNGLIVTAGGGSGNFYPRITANVHEPDWMLSTANSFTSASVQRLTSDRVGTTPTPTTLTRRKSDFNGDGMADVTTFRPSTGSWSIRGQQGDTWGRVGDLPVPADYNGDGKIEVGVFRPSTGEWFIRDTGVAIEFGLAGDIPVPADYDGDGKDDIAVFRPSTGVWYVRGTASGVKWGSPGDIPVPADYDGDGKTDMAVFRRSTGSWFIVGQPRIDYGLPGDIPVPGDYDGDKKTDICIYRPSSGLWFARNQFVVHFGSAGFMPMALDLDGDGKDELVLFEKATAIWRVYNRATNAVTALTQGAAGDQVISPVLLTMFPAAGDADGDRRADTTVFRPSTSTWYAHRSSDGATTPISFGLPGDVPAPADYDGDGKLDYAVFRSDSGSWFVTLSSNNFATYAESGPWGIPGDVVLPGDYDGDGRADLAVFRPSTGVWYIKESSTAFVTSTVMQWGVPGDVPIPADFDGDGRL